MSDTKQKENINDIEIKPWFSIDTYYSDIMNNMLVDKVHEDEKAHWMLGISALIMSLTLSSLKAGFVLENIGFIIIFLSSLVSFLFCLFIIGMPKFMRKIPHSYKSHMYYHGDISPDEYADRIRNIRTFDQFSDQYAHNIANLVNRNNRLKSRLIDWPIYIMFFGVLFGFTLILLFGGISTFEVTSSTVGH